MSDHWSTTLELAEPQLQAADAVRLLETALREAYGFDAGLDQGELTRSSICGEIVLGSTQVWLEVFVASKLPEASARHVALLLDSGAYELAYDTVRQRLNPHGLETLIGFCVDMAGAACAAGFRLQFGNSMSEHFNLDALVAAMKQPGPSAGLIVGLQEALPHWQDVRTHWPNWRKFGAYQIEEFIS
jgi:hypothetical protein